MSNSANTLSEVLNNLGIQAENVQEFINKLSQVLTTNSSQVQINQRSVADPTVVNNITVPSFGYVTARVENIEQKFNSLLDANNNLVGVKSADGTVKRFELLDITQTISDLEKISGANLPLPSRFKTKNNWFFESFLSPLLYVPVDVTAYITDDIGKFEVRRVIVTTNEDSELISFFNTNYKGKNNVDYTSLIRTLLNNKITYTEDTNIIDLPGAINKYRGTFIVQKITEVTTPEIVNGQILTYNKIKYTLDHLDYTDVTGATAASQRRELVAGSRLITEGNSEYLVESISTTDKTVILKRVFGSDGITLFEKLRIKPEVYRSPILGVNIGYNEREVIFIKPISNKMDLTVDYLSNGFGIYTNELLITTQAGETLSLADYYNNFVSDFGMLFLAYAKEKKVPNSLGYKPSAPVLSANSFKVLQADSHIADTQSVNTIKELLAKKESLNSTLREHDKSIDSIKKTLNATGDQNESIRLKAQSDLKNKSDARDQTFSELSTTVKQLSTNIKSVPEFSAQPKYRVRGFWSTPPSVETPYGTQHVIQFKVSYRYLNANKNASTAAPITFTDSNGTQRTGYFSPYTEFLTKAKKKEYNESTGVYEWVEENVADPDSINFNQLDIAIRKGESVQIRIKSLSEAGYPENPVESDWSDPVTVDFPGEIQSTEETTLLAQQTFAEETRIALQEELNARGLSQHLSTSFTSKDKYYAHSSAAVASGFFLSDGTAISLYDKLVELSDALAALKTSVSTAKADMQISIVTPEGTEIQVTNGTTVDIFAGYYKDLAITSTGEEDAGKIISKEYQVKIRNTSATPLELYAALGGAIGIIANPSFPGSTIEQEYNQYQRYDKVPINVNGIEGANFASIAQKTGYQSAQVKSQYIFSRYFNIDHTKQLYYGDGGDQSAETSITNPASYLVDDSYDFKPSYPTTNNNYTAGHYLPTIQNGGTQSSVVWNGVVSSNTAAGNGYLTEFCIHKDHPYLKTLGTGTLTDNPQWLKPVYTTLATDSAISETQQKLLPFSHAIHFSTVVENNANEFKVPYWAQAEYDTPSYPGMTSRLRPGISITPSLNTFPIKIGFSTGDEYLIGKKTCGAYLFMMPQSYATISVDGSHPKLSAKTVSSGSGAALSIPVVFQFRAKDKAGYVGGWRADGLRPTNVTYEKLLGLDIYTKDKVFSFDIKVNAKYQRDTVIASPTVFTPKGNSTQLGNTSTGANIQDLTDILKNSKFSLRTDA
jgi:hypothetical protein